ncbi:BBP7 family outer membrane beta-barrel protein [Rubripirellula amarantea]|nr:BBP7 family outer membrane beta-barrel protein [Rubripirellula amarantea]
MKLVDHVISESVIEKPIRGQLDDRIALSPVPGSPIDGLPVYDGGEFYEGGPSSCDAMPSGDCGCGLGGCDGGCDSLGCDSLGCGSCGGAGCSTCGELVSPNAWRPCLTLCVPQDGWVSFEYLMWWQDGMSLPPLVTTSVGTAIPATESGVLGQGHTRTLFGGNDVLTDSIDGGRLRFGVWLDKCHTWGLGAEYFELGEESEGYSRTSNGSPLLSRPFFNTETGVEDAELVAFPGILSGNVTARATSKLTGAGVHLRHLQCCYEGCGRGLFCGCDEKYCSRTETMYGYRFLELEESVTVTEALVSSDNSNPGSFDILDRFETRNQFNGFDIGWMYKRTRGFWTFDALLRMGIGNTRQTVRIDGSTTINTTTQTPQVQTFEGGLLTQPTNIAVYEQDQFTVVPEFGLTAGYQLTDHLRATLGYTFIYWSNVVRPGDQISRDVNPNWLPPRDATVEGARRPGFEFDTTDYWVQGISFGGEYRW